ncbi:hypothetical protein [Nocardioides sp.]|uniref:hypothetical protein n=1 Tax=Nocardioides sp. TaxID=35761 RepID=UPI0027172278|nr:hypothetical protein [Nocardioides sp.]MDO9457837.1 hypothetical protein [Nocardioides sp.]
MPAPHDLAQADVIDDVTARRSTAIDRFTASVTHLLDERADLHGVHPMADLVYDAVRWSA